MERATGQEVVRISAKRVAIVGAGFAGLRVDRGRELWPYRRHWIPAFAGMTEGHPPFDKLRVSGGPNQASPGPPTRVSGRPLHSQKSIYQTAPALSAVERQVGALVSK